MAGRTANTDPRDDERQTDVGPQTRWAEERTARSSRKKKTLHKPLARHRKRVYSENYRNPCNRLLRYSGYLLVVFWSVVLFATQGRKARRSEYGPQCILLMADAHIHIIIYYYYY